MSRGFTAAVLPIKQFLPDEWILNKLSGFWPRGGNLETQNNLTTLSTKVTLIKIHSWSLGAACSFKKHLASGKGPTRIYFRLWHVQRVETSLWKEASNEISGAVPLKKYNLESSGEKAAASMAWGRSDQRWRRARGPLTLPDADTVQNTPPRNTRTVLVSSGHTTRRTAVRTKWPDDGAHAAGCAGSVYPAWWRRTPPGSTEAGLGPGALWTPTPAAQRSGPDPAASPGGSPTVYLNNTNNNKRTSKPVWSCGRFPRRFEGLISQSVL